MKKNWERRNYDDLQWSLLMAIYGIMRMQKGSVVWVENNPPNSSVPIGNIGNRGQFGLLGTGL